MGTQSTAADAQTLALAATHQENETKPSVLQNKTGSQKILKTKVLIRLLNQSTF